MTKISVVVPARNAAHCLPACLQALQMQVGFLLHEIIVVDNNSTDQTPLIAQQAGVRLFHQPQPGAAAARNLGIRAATGDIICFTDADCRPTANWLEQLTAPLRHDPTLAGCKGVYLTEQPALVARFVQLEYEDKYDQLRQHTYIDFVDTYSAAYRRDILRRHPFDPQVAYVEDQELSFRLAAQGYKMSFQPTAKVYHLHADSLWRYGRKKYHIGYWKAQIMRRFPQRLVQDSHTPQILKVQIGLIGLAGLAVCASWFRPRWGLTAAGGLLGLFLATTLPFVRKAWLKDRPVAVLSPALLAVRAFALGLGYLWGTLRPRADISPTRWPHPLE